MTELAVPPPQTTPEQLARRFLAALSEGDREAVGGLVHPEVEIHTARTTHRGAEAAMDWSAKAYDHLIRRYVADRIEGTGDGVHIHGHVEYVWRESGEVGDTAPVEIELGIRDGLISSWLLRD